MKTLERIKKECEIKGLDFELVMYNIEYYPEELRYFNGKLYGTKHRIYGKPCFSVYKTEIILEDYV